MVKLIIDGKEVNVKQGTTILAAAQKAGINIPTLCYLKDVNEIGACRICLCEIEGVDRLQASCNTVCEEGMTVHTRSPRVLAARKANLKLILSRHNTSCTTCLRDGSCTLQELSKEFNLSENEYIDAPLPCKWEKDLPLIRDASKCIQCLRCVNICEKVQKMKVWELSGTGQRAKIGVRDGIRFRDINCSLCGQCITHCPVGALTERDDTGKVLRALADPETVTVFQIAPAVRAAFADACGISLSEGTEKRMVSACRALGADYVFDTDFAADLTIMEEGSELLEKIKENGTVCGTEQKKGFPMFTSCCPGWVRFMKTEFPDMVSCLSTSKSPQQMFGAAAKSYFAEKAGISPERICCISVMPCTAKKYECDVPEVNDASEKDVDISITTRELGRMLRGIDVASLPESEFDSPLGTGTGAAVIFGATGGVMEAALRSAYYLVSGENAPADAFCEVRAEGADAVGQKCWREAEFDIKGTKLSVAVASGLGNARALMESIQNGEVNYDFVEIMACPGGCAGGGGQPIRDGAELADQRGKQLYQLDKGNKLRFSHENPDVLELYGKYLEKPLSEKAEKLLHTNQKEWRLS